jgi:hypothetical protein
MVLLFFIQIGYSSNSFFELDSRIRTSEKRRTDYAIGLFGGINSSKFLFINSTGQQDKNYDYIGGSNFGVNLVIASGFHQFRPEISFHKAGAKYVDNYNNHATYETSYMGVNLGYLLNVVRSRYDFMGAGNAAPYSIRLGVLLGFNYMINGSQIINENIEISLIRSNAFSRFDINASGIVTFGIRLTNLLAFNVEYRFNYGMIQIEKDPSQKTHNLNHSFLLALYHKLDW